MFRANAMRNTRRENNTFLHYVQFGENKTINKTDEVIMCVRVYMCTHVCVWEVFVAVCLCGFFCLFVAVFVLLLYVCMYVCITHKCVCM